jgi:hypothetical protein
VYETLRALHIRRDDYGFAIGGGNLGRAGRSYEGPS